MMISRAVLMRDCGGTRSRTGPTINKTIRRASFAGLSEQQRITTLFQLTYSRRLPPWPHRMAFFRRKKGKAVEDIHSVLNIRNFTCTHLPHTTLTPGATIFSFRNSTMEFNLILRNGLPVQRMRPESSSASNHTKMAPERTRLFRSISFKRLETGDKKPCRTASKTI